MQFLTSARVITVNFSLKEERALFQGFQKLVAILIALLQSVLYVVCGMYGPVSVVKSVFIVVQLFGAAMMVVYLDELIQKGYGLGSGISLFTCAAVCADVMWKVNYYLFIYCYPHTLYCIILYLSACLYAYIYLTPL
jgi:protein transport protein SEC61 subunit alpha